MNANGNKLDEVLSEVRQQHQKIVQQVTAQIKEFTSTGNQTFVDAVTSNISDFIEAINWRDEKWLQGLLAFHVVFFLIIWFTRHRKNLHTILFLVILALVFSAEKLNSFASQHWQQFSTQNYFDKSGIFVTTVYSAPLVLNAVFMLGLYLAYTAQLLVQVKARQFKAHMQAQNKQKKE